MSAYTQLEESFYRLTNIEGATAILDWDWAVIMPKGSAETRSNQLSELSLIRHEILSDPKLSDLLSNAEEEGKLDDWQRANLREMRRNWLHSNAMRSDLIAALNKATSKCEMLWREARETNDFRSFSIGFEPLLGLIREKAQAKSEMLKMSLYDVLVDEYDPGFRAIDIDNFFSDLQSFLPSLLGEILDTQANQTMPIRPMGPFNLSKQKELSLKLMEKIGFDFDNGRLDESHHPFCGGVPGDVRITTKYDEDDFTSSMMAVLHETGHALYECGLPKNWRYQPVGKAPSMSLHESQSLLLEMQVCRSQEFYSFVTPLIKTAFLNSESKTFEGFDLKNLYKLAIRVTPGPIRIYADEVTYPLHIMLRYHLEKDMIEGRLEVNDLPDAWGHWMRDLLGVVPRDHGEGCLQDIHWATGDIGYFPSYTLGALIAAQFFEKAERDIKKIKSNIALGDFGLLKRWLYDSVHSQGSRYLTQELVKRVTGRPLDARAFEKHLKTRYLG